MAEKSTRVDVIELEATQQYVGIEQVENVLNNQKAGPFTMDHRRPAQKDDSDMEVEGGEWIQVERMIVVQPKSHPTQPVVFPVSEPEVLEQLRKHPQFRNRLESSMPSIPSERTPETYLVDHFNKIHIEPVSSETLRESLTRVESMESTNWSVGVQTDSPMTASIASIIATAQKPCMCWCVKFSSLKHVGGAAGDRENDGDAPDRSPESLTLEVDRILQEAMDKGASTT